MMSRIISILLVILIFSGQVHAHGVSLHRHNGAIAFDAHNSDGLDFTNLMSEMEWDEEDESDEKSLEKCFLLSGAIFTGYFNNPSDQIFDHSSNGIHSNELIICFRNLRL
ncbi:MAG: hypothetical protein ACKOW8_12310 [Flavobacteriales bacterium]